MNITEELKIYLRILKGLTKNANAVTFYEIYRNVKVRYWYGQDYFAQAQKQADLKHDCLVFEQNLKDLNIKTLRTLHLSSETVKFLDK